MRIPLLFVAIALAGTLVAGQEKPNILLIIADDCTYSDLGIYGGQAKTPHLAKLASEGMIFSKCYQAAPMCSPTRHCLYTGLYPVKSGAYPNHTRAYGWVKSIAHHLQSAGYATHLSGKTHIAPKSVFPFHYSGVDNNPDPSVFSEVIESSGKSGKPFLFIAASNEPHTPWNKGDPSAYPPASLKLPPVLVGSPKTREGFSKYLAEITYFDSQVGELLDRLDRSPLSDNTLVIVLSEQGNSLPFAKWTCYDVGLHSGCVIRWPGKVKPGSRSDALIEYVDVVPTFLEAAGIPRPEILDGRSFLPVLEGGTDTHKKYAFGLQTTRGINNGSDHYAIRSANDGRYRYIRNLTPEQLFLNTMMEDPIFKEWEKMAGAGDENAKKLVHDYRHRPAEELYDTTSDPWNRKNLIDDKSLAGIRDGLSSALDGWMKQQGDEGNATEMKAFDHMPRKGKE
ncbi:sulfatase [Akkermansiaceae bacterium]|nr:sulfatase [Akkermansiaceae bacterium]